MPTSTVFSYWRREHRRQAPNTGSNPSSPLTVSTQGTSFGEQPPRLPGLPETPTLSDALNDSSTFSNPQSPSTLPDDLPIPARGEASGTQGLTPQSSLTNPQRPSPEFLENSTRPHSSAGERSAEEILYSAPNRSQQSLTLLRTDGPDTYVQKSTTARGAGLSRSNVNFPVEEYGRGDQRESSAHIAGQINNVHVATLGEPAATTGGGFSRGYNFSKDYGFSKDYKTDNVAVTQREVQSDIASEQGHQKSGKTRLHLLNPMSLLARRRASQVTNSRPEDVNFVGHKLVPAIPDDYDPRIRGHIIHDFSAPRPPRRQVAADSDSASAQSSARDAQSNSGPDGPQRRSKHSPVFKEHFGDQEHALQVENKGYLQSTLMVNTSLHDDDPTQLPAFARKLPIHLPENEERATRQPVKAAVKAVKPEPVQPPSSPPAPVIKTSPPRQNQTVTPSGSQRSAAGPHRLKSNSSRFSFDMNGVGSSVQERLLEEKHKEKEAARKEKARLNHFDYDDFDDDDFDYDAMDDMADLEEQIPGVNADADEDAFNNYPNFVGAAQPPLFVPALPAIAASPLSPNMPPLPIPQDPHGPINDYEVPSTLSASDSASDYGDPLPEETRVAQQQFAQEYVEDRVSNDFSEKTSQSADEDDLYFDDGGFGEISTAGGDQGFDESIFDDESNQFHDHRFFPATIASVADSKNAMTSVLPARDVTTSLPGATIQPAANLVSQAQGSTGLVQNGIVQQIYGSRPSPSPPGILTEHNLEALHTALTRVADEAEAVKRLQRNLSIGNTSQGQESLARTSDSHPDLISDDSRLSQGMDAMGFEDVFDDFNYDDDAYNDDPIIAEANAEALENDEEGFYGREFGFYAQSRLNCDGEPVHGGFFGPRDVDGVHRSHSGRVPFREPSLTPITERSEYSTRNSMISLSAHGLAQSNTSVPGPGLAQLVDMEDLGEEMSLESLRKLRRGAFGGSNGSLRGSESSLSPQAGPTGSSNRTSAVGITESARLSITSMESPAPLMNDPAPLFNGHLSGSVIMEGESRLDSPTLTFNPTAGLTRGSNADGDVVRTGTGKTNRSSHSRASSSASISYTKEVDEDGSSKWILERRRTSDSGEIEVYEREVLEEGRI